VIAITVAAPKLPVPLPGKIDTFEPLLTAMSGMQSRLKSAETSLCAPLDVLLSGALKPPAPLLIKMWMTLEFEAVAAISGLPSTLKSETSISPAPPNSTA